MKRQSPFFLLVPAMLAALAACSGRPPAPTAAVPTVRLTAQASPVPPVIQTRIVVVTATPQPTPTYVSSLKSEPGTLTVPLAQEPASLDAQQAADESAVLVTQQLYEGLFALRGDNSVVPAAAGAYQVSADSQTYTVTLRTGLRWSDGSPLTAQQYVDGFCRLLDPALGNRYAYLLADVAHVSGASAYASGQAPDCSQVGVRAVSTTTLQIALSAPLGFLPQVLASGPFMPARGQPADDKQTIVGNGPYRLEEWRRGDRIVVAKNPDYWNADAVSIQRIELRVVPEAARQLELYKAGELATVDVAPDSTAAILEQPGLNQELHVLARPGISYLGLNTQEGPTADANFRKAIASALNREALIQDALHQPWHTPAASAILPGFMGYQAPQQAGYPYNPQAAQAFLKAAGYGPGKPVPAVEIWANREGNNMPLLAAVSSMLEAAGIPTRLVTSNWDLYLASLAACNKSNQADATRTPAECSDAIYRMGWVMDYADPSSFLASAALHYTGWQSQEYQGLLGKARAETDAGKRDALYQQAEKLLLDEAVVVPLQYYDRPVLVKEGIGFEFPAVGAPGFQYWKLP